MLICHWPKVASQNLLQYCFAGNQIVSTSGHLGGRTLGVSVPTPSTICRGFVIKFERERRKLKKKQDCKGCGGGGGGGD